MGYEELKSMALKKVSNRFLLVKILADRIRRLDKGAPPLIETNGSFNSMEIALREIIEGKINLRKRDEVIIDKGKTGIKKKEEEEN